MPRNRIVVTTLCEETLTDKSYQKILTHSFFCCKREKRIVDFWKMKANAQNAKTKTAVLKNCVCDRMVGCGVWPPWSPRLTTPDLLLCGFRKESLQQGWRIFLRTRAQIAYKLCVVCVTFIVTTHKAGLLRIVLSAILEIHHSSLNISTRTRTSHRHQKRNI
jgi:hypothetical protein